MSSERGPRRDWTDAEMETEVRRLVRALEGEWPLRRYIEINARGLSPEIARRGGPILWAFRVGARLDADSVRTSAVLAALRFIMKDRTEIPSDDELKAVGGPLLVDLVRRGTRREWLNDLLESDQPKPPAAPDPFRHRKEQVKQAFDASDEPELWAQLDRMIDAVEKRHRWLVLVAKQREDVRDDAIAVGRLLDWLRRFRALHGELDVDD